jgi:hypothetical protein
MNVGAPFSTASVSSTQSRVTDRSWLSTSYAMTKRVRAAV